MSDASDIQLLGRAYLSLMELPLEGLTRHRIQPALCCLRDEIASIKGVEPELVQNVFEKAAGRLS